MTPIMLELLVRSLWETILMTGASGIISLVAGLPLGSPERHSDCVMENLIGDDVQRVPELLAEPDLMLHLYGKAEARPGRKMGHFTRISRRT